MDSIGISHECRNIIDEMNERNQRMCNYCENQKPLQVACPGGIGYNSYNVIKGNILNDADGCDIIINFCPMCGRELSNEHK